MEIRHLKYFLVLSEELHFRRASEKLFITQPALTRQIKNLEQELGVQLFDRNKRKVTLLDTGQLLRKETMLLFKRIDDMKSDLKLVGSGLVGELKIGHVGSAMHSVLPQLIMKYKNAYPNIILKLFEWTTNQQIKALQKGDLDIGFIRSRVNTSDLLSKSIYTENLAIVLPSNHKIKKKNFKGLKGLSNENFILIPRASGEEYYDKIIHVFNRLGFSPKITHETVFADTTMKLVEAGVGISILPASMEEYNPHIKFIQLPYRISLFLCYRKNMKNTIVNNFIDNIATII